MALSSMCVQFVVLIVMAGGAQSQNSTSPTEAPCRNTTPDCHYHRREEICHGIYRPWASARCALYCGFCTVPGGYEEDCEDAIPNCVQYQPCNNPSFFVWVEDHCRKYCHHCGPSTTVSVTSSAPTITPQSSPSLTTPFTPSHALTTPTPAAASSAKMTATTMKTTEQKTPPPATTTHAVASPGSTVAQVTPGCTDQLAFCSQYAKSACDNRLWALTYCARFCDLCNAAVQTASTQTAQPTSRKPEATTKQETGTTSVPVVTSSAKVTTSGPPAWCRDALASCSFYSPVACGDQQWGRTYCARFCNLCT